MAVTLSIIALVIALISAGAALGLWRSAHRANQISATVAEIEANRRHDEQTPEFDIKISEAGSAGDHAGMEVRLLRPAHLDEVVIKILDEANVDHWGHGLPDGVTQEEAELFVWGPWEFNAGASQQVANNRTTLPRRYSRATGRDSEVFDLVKTRPGHWMGDTAHGSWEQERSGPVRLSFECRLDGEQPWQVSYEVQPQVGPFAMWR